MASKIKLKFCPGTLNLRYWGKTIFDKYCKKLGKKKGNSTKFGLIRVHLVETDVKNELKYCPGMLNLRYLRKKNPQKIPQKIPITKFFTKNPTKKSHENFHQKIPRKYYICKKSLNKKKSHQKFPSANNHLYLT